MQFHLNCMVDVISNNTSIQIVRLGTSVGPVLRRLGDKGEARLPARPAPPCIGTVRYIIV